MILNIYAVCDLPMVIWAKILSFLPLRKQMQLVTSVSKVFRIVDKIYDYNYQSNSFNYCRSAHELIRKSDEITCMFPYSSFPDLNRRFHMCNFTFNCGWI